MARQVSETTRICKDTFSSRSTTELHENNFGMALVVGIRTQRPAGLHNVILTAFVSWSRQKALHLHPHPQRVMLCYLSYSGLL